MQVDKRSKDSVYIHLNGNTYFIDDSTGEQIVNYWSTGTTGSFFEEKHKGKKVLIPEEPERAYADEFVSYADFLGVGTSVEK